MNSIKQILVILSESGNYKTFTMTPIFQFHDDIDDDGMLNYWVPTFKEYVDKPLDISKLFINLMHFREFYQFEIVKNEIYLINEQARFCKITMNK